MRWRRESVSTERRGERTGASCAGWGRAATQRGRDERGATDKAVNSPGLPGTGAASALGLRQPAHGAELGHRRSAPGWWARSLRLRDRAGMLSSVWIRGRKGERHQSWTMT
jgi:hypothetical protein